MDGDDTGARLDRIRGPVPPRRHNARTISALTGNPGCARRAVMDAAGVDKALLAGHVGFPAPYGQSGFAIARGNAFEARLKVDGAVELRTLLSGVLGVDLTTARYVDAEAGAPPDGDAGTDTVFDHPSLRLDVAGRTVHLEPDLVTVCHDGVFHIVEIKSFPVIDGQADSAKVAAAAMQAAVYALALRRMLGRADAVSHDAVLVCPKDFSNTPTAVRMDVRRQLMVLEHQLARLARVDTLLADLPADLTLDPALDDNGRPTRPAGELAAALGRIAARYAPECLATCELSYFCRDEAAGGTVALGRTVREELGGVETVADVLTLAAGADPGPGVPADAAALLRTVAEVYESVLPAR